MFSVFLKTTTVAMLMLCVCGCGDVAAEQQVVIHQMTGRTTEVDTSHLPTDWSVHTAKHDAIAGSVTEVRVTGGPVRVIVLPATQP